MAAEKKKRKYRRINRRKGIGGRPSVMTESVIRILEEAFMNGMTDLRACEMAKISKTSFYHHLNIDSKFADRIELAKEFLVQAARMVVSSAIKQKDINTAKWYLERKAKEEFGVRTEVTGAEGEPINQNSDDIANIASSLDTLLNNPGHELPAKSEGNGKATS